MTTIKLLGDEPKQWLVIIKPKIRYAKHMLSTYMVVVEETEERAALYAAKNLHPTIFNTLDRRYHDPVAKPVELNVLRKLIP